MRKLLVAIAIFGSCVQSPAAPAASPLVGTSLNGTPLADQFAGVDMCAKITAAIASLGSAGGIGTGGNNSAYAGSATLSLPMTNNAAIVTDPVSDLFANYYFTANSTRQFGQALAVTAGQPWKALFIGYWANNYEGGGLNVPAEITEVTSTSPFLNIGSIQLAFSINSSGHLQATNGNLNYAAVFTGHVIVLPESYLSSAGTHSMSVTGTVSAAAIETTNGTPVSSSAACEPKSMWTDASYIYVCVSSNTIRRVALSAFP